MNRFALPLASLRASRRGARDQHPPFAGQGHHRLAAHGSRGAGIFAAESHGCAAYGELPRTSKAAGTCSMSGAPGAENAAPSTPCCSRSGISGAVPIIGLDWKDEDDRRARVACPAGQPLPGDRGGSRRPHGDRLGCVRRTGELSSSIRRASSSTNSSAPLTRESWTQEFLPRLRTQRARVLVMLRAWLPFMAVIAARGRAAGPCASIRRTCRSCPRGALSGAHARVALHAMPERVDRGLTRRSGLGPAPRGARHAARRQERR